MHWGEGVTWGSSSPPLWDPGQCPEDFFLDPVLGGANLPMVLCLVFKHGCGHDGLGSTVLDALACMYMYYNIERNIMKNQSGSPGFGIHGKIFVYMCFMYYALAFFIFCVLEFSCK